MIKEFCNDVKEFIIERIDIIREDPLLLAAVILFIFLLGNYLGFQGGKKKLQKQAVEAGHAKHNDVTSDFEWLPSCRK